MAISRIFLHAIADLATAAFFKAARTASLARAAAGGAKQVAPTKGTRDMITRAILSAPRRAAPGPSVVRTEHLRALGDAGFDGIVGDVELLVAEAAVPAHTLKVTQLILLAKLKGHEVDGLPRLRPIAMPEAFRTLAESALALTVRASAAEAQGPVQLGARVSIVCERILHELDAHLAQHPSHAVVQLDVAKRNRAHSTLVGVAHKSCLPFRGNRKKCKAHTRYPCCGATPPLRNKKMLCGPTVSSS